MAGGRRVQAAGVRTVDKKLQYYRDNYDRMKYDEYILNGWFIGCGSTSSTTGASRTWRRSPLMPRDASYGL